MAFGAGTVVTNKGKAMLADRLRAAPGTYTVSPHFMAMGVGATGAGRTAAITDTALSTQVESRTSGTESAVTTTVAGDTYQCAGAITASAARNVDEFGLFDAASSGNMGFSATFTVIPLANAGDAIIFTAKIQLTP